MESSKIIFFDGVCNLCNNFVDYLITKKQINDYKFSSIQGETSKQFLNSETIKKLNTVVVYIDGKTLVRSTAALHLLSLINPIWKVFWIFPAPLRDIGYRLISRFRYSLFGKRDTCRLPTKEEEARFLD